MNKIDIKSVIIGMLFTACIFLFMGQQEYNPWISGYNPKGALYKNSNTIEKTLLLCEEIHKNMCDKNEIINILNDIQKNIEYIK